MQKNESNLLIAKKPFEISTSKKVGVAIASSILAVVSCTSMFFAEGGLSEIFDKIKKITAELYPQFVGISTGLAVLIVAICLIIRIVSKNQRSVDEATQWIKRVVITWCILQMLGIFVKFFEEITGNGSSGYSG